MPLFDSHCHLDAPEFDEDRAAVLAAAGAEGIGAILVPAYVAERWAQLLVWATQADTPSLRLLPALGLHPVFVDQHRDDALQVLVDLLQRHADVVAVGEIGLDRLLETLVTPAAWARQVALFEAQLAIAKAHGRPVILHARRSHAAIMASLKRVGFQGGGIVHAFAGSWEEAVQYQRLGFVLGFGGVLTYPGARRVREVAARLPLSQLVIETDAPDMRGRDWPSARNEPKALPQVLQALAALRAVSAQELEGALWANTWRALGRAA